MTGQNTEKQILAMVVLLVLAVASLGAYVWFDNGRRTEAASEVFERDSERGAHIFARNCRVCHGNDGGGRESNAALVGPVLNTPANTFAWRTENAGQLASLQNDFRFTIACGRNGTPMPPWALDQGGSLDPFKIENLVTLITTNAGDGWHTALEAAIHEDELAIANLEVALEGAQRVVNGGGWSPDVEAAQTAVNAAEAADAQLVLLRNALADAQTQLDALNADGAGEDDLAAAQLAADDAGAALTNYERVYTRLVLDVIEINAGSLDDDDELVIAARGRLSDAAGVARDIAEQRAWLKVATDLANAQANLDDAEERFEAGLPISHPPAQVTSNTCGQVHHFGAVDLLTATADGGQPDSQPDSQLGGWLASLSADDS